jgi:hypothetical protein
VVMERNSVSPTDGGTWERETAPVFRHRPLYLATLRAIVLV